MLKEQLYLLDKWYTIYIYIVYNDKSKILNNTYYSTYYS